MARFLVLLCVGLGVCIGRSQTDAPTPPTPSQEAAADESTWDPAPAFWVWDRTAFRPDDLEELQAVGSSRLYWLLEDMQTSFPSPSSIRDYELIDYCPVIRFPPGAETVLQDRCWSLLRPSKSGVPAKITIFDRYMLHGELQIDFDCPASLLPQYAARLKKLRKDLELDHLSVTALASWIDAPGFDALEKVADELVPMFYDLEKDEAADVRNGQLHRLIDASTVAWIRKWKACSSPWRAGLPNYQRLTFFNEDGSLVGHHRKWSINGLITHPAIEPLAQQPDQMRLYQVTANGSLAGTRISRKQTLVWRQPDETTTRQAIEAARTAGARGIVWFAHPASPSKAWHSVPHLAALQAGSKPSPKLTIQIRPAGTLRLINEGPGDLIMHPTGRPFKLVIEAPPGSFGHGGPDHFLRKQAPGASLNHPETIRRVELEFAKLHSGESLSTANRFLHLTDPDQLTWSVQPAP